MADVTADAGVAPRPNLDQGMFTGLVMVAFRKASFEMRMGLASIVRIKTPMPDV